MRLNAGGICMVYTDKVHRENLFLFERERGGGGEGGSYWVECEIGIFRLLCCCRRARSSVILFR